MYTYIFFKEIHKTHLQCTYKFICNAWHWFILVCILIIEWGKNTHCGRWSCKKEMFMQQLARIKSRCLFFFVHKHYPSFIYVFNVHIILNIWWSIEFKTLPYFDNIFFFTTTGIIAVMSFSVIQKKGQFKLCSHFNNYKF